MCRRTVLLLSETLLLLYIGPHYVQVQKSDLICDCGGANMVQRVMAQRSVRFYWF